MNAYTRRKLNQFAEKLRAMEREITVVLGSETDPSIKIWESKAILDVGDAQTHLELALLSDQRSAKK